MLLNFGTTNGEDASFPETEKFKASMKCYSVYHTNDKIVCTFCLRKKFFNGKILYVANGSASSNPYVFAITLGGDVHPYPGPSLDNTSIKRPPSHRFSRNKIRVCYKRK